MNSNRPYLLRALSEWILDNDCTPYLVVDVAGDQVAVPEEYVKNGQIILNIRPDAVLNLLLSNEAVSFEARFAGVPRQIYVPMENIVAVYAQETGQGMTFGGGVLPADPPSGPQPSPGSSPKAGKSSSKGRLKIVK